MRVPLTPIPEAPPAQTAPAWAERMVGFLDDGFRIPGTSMRVGFDAVLGLLLPGFGDILTSAGGLSLFAVAHQRRVPKVVLARMVLNLGIDALVGIVPLLGDVFDVAFKANRKNLRLLERYREQPAAPPRASDKLVVALAVLGALAAVALPIALGIWLLGKLGSQLSW